MPTFSVTRLPELTQFLQETAPTAANLEAIAAAGEAAAAGAEALAASSRSSSSRTADALSSLDGVDPSSIDLLGWSLRSLGSMSSTDEDDDAAAAGILGGLPLDPNTPGAPAPGLDFFDFLVEQGAIKTATTSFPRMGECSNTSVQQQRASAGQALGWVLACMVVEAYGRLAVLQQGRQTCVAVAAVSVFDCR